MSEIAGARPILFIHPDERIAREMAELLGGAGEPATAASLETALPILEARRFELCLVDAEAAAAPAAIERLRQLDTDLEIVAIVPADRPKLGAGALRAGCADFVAWPAGPEELRSFVARGIDRGRLRREHRRLLTENIEGLHAQALYRRCLDMLAVVDLEPLQKLVLALFSELVDAQSAALWLRSEGGALLLSSHRGLVDRASLPLRLDPGDGPFAARLEGSAPFSSGADGGCYVPLSAQSRLVGLLFLGDRLAGPFTSADLGRAQAVGELAAIALRNARRFAELERIGLRDRDSPAYNLSYFIDYAGKELYKAQRYGREFSLVSVRVENLEALRRERPPEAIAEALRGFVARLAGLARDADILSKVAEAEFYAVLPETDRFGGMVFERRVLDLARQLEATATDDGPALRVTVGGATFPGDGHDFDELLDRCRARIDESRGTLCRRLQLDELDFWQTLDALRGPSATAGRGANPSVARVDPALFSAVQRELGREVSRLGSSRALLYLGVPELRAELPLLQALPGRELVPRIYVLGRRGPAEISHPSVTPVCVDPAAAPRAADHAFALFLSAGGAYGFFHEKGATQALHTDDRFLVDHLVSRLQQAFDLQPY